ncbi:unnamed protein product [Symbiodinium natans]|uniref:Uncharacterized protein n=1 Tax=Symbiodinium natans TaxID=878477 RepID=A0A812UAB9_9DINO|nr:unnamed protein product [Symbiodinium natans]
MSEAPSVTNGDIGSQACQTDQPGQCDKCDLEQSMEGKGPPGQEGMEGKPKPKSGGLPKNRKNPNARPKRPAKAAAKAATRHDGPVRQGPQGFGPEVSLRPQPFLESGLVPPWMHPWGPWPPPGMILGLRPFSQVQHPAADLTFRQCAGSQPQGSKPSHPTQALQHSQPNQLQQRLWHQMAMNRGLRDALSSQACPARQAPPSSIWDVFIDNNCDPGESRSSRGSSYPQKAMEDLLKPYLVASSMMRKDTLTNCEAASECSTADTTTTSWMAFHADEAALAERIAAVLMDRESASIPGSDVLPSAPQGSDLQCQKS